MNLAQFPVCISPQVPRSFNGICIVGEAPGQEEEKRGQPFVGPSGRLLNEMMEDAGIRRQDCLICNVFHRRPPRNQLDYFLTSSAPSHLEYDKLNGKWLHNQLDDDLLRFRRRLQRFHPPVIVATGGTAAWALLGYQGMVGRLHAENPHEPFDWLQLDKNTKVLVMFHPSYLLRVGPTEEKSLFEMGVKTLVAARRMARNG